MSDTPITDALSTDPAIDRRDVPARVWRVMADMERALHAILDSEFAEDCQECAIGQTEAWKQAKALLGRK